MKDDERKELEEKIESLETKLKQHEKQRESEELEEYTRRISQESQHKTTVRIWIYIAISLVFLLLFTNPSEW